jgi:C1A family cysteine protease
LDGDEDELKRLVYEYGPIVITMHSTDSFTRYKSGIFYESSCPQEINHALGIIQFLMFFNHNFGEFLVVVGYGSENGTDFWWLRNSWGKKWGYEGYGKFARNKDNHCGIASYAMLPSNYFI